MRQTVVIEKCLNDSKKERHLWMKYNFWSAVAIDRWTYVKLDTNII